MAKPPFFHGKTTIFPWENHPASSGGSQWQRALVLPTDLTDRSMAALARATRDSDWLGCHGMVRGKKTMKSLGFFRCFKEVPKNFWKITGKKVCQHGLSMILLGKNRLISKRLMGLVVKVRIGTGQSGKIWETGRETRVAHIRMGKIIVIDWDYKPKLRYPKASRIGHSKQQTKILGDLIDDSNNSPCSSRNGTNARVSPGN